VVGEPKRLVELTKMVVPEQKEVKDLRVAIYGGGEYGFALAQVLTGWGVKVRVFETNEDRCRFLSEELPTATILHADATLMEELQDEQIEDADFFVATSPSDEDNVMSCLQATQLKVPKCLSLVHRADYARTISNSGRHLGIRAAVSPREATLRNIERFITDDQFHIVKSYADQDIIEVEVAQYSSVDGLLLKEIDWPPQCIVIAKLHKSVAKVPGPEDRLEAEDIIYAIVKNEHRKRFVKMLTS